MGSTARGPKGGRGRIDLSNVAGHVPYRMALAGGWIDQPFVSRMNPARVGSMVVAQVYPDVPVMPRSGLATGTRKVANLLWDRRLPDRPPAELVRELYRAENDGKPEPSGSQDMIGLVYPGISRLDYDHRHEGGVFPRHIETCRDPGVARWLSDVIHVVAVAPRPAGYSPLGVQRLEPALVERLGASGAACYDAIVRKDLAALGASMNECTRVWDALMPHIFRHPVLEVDLLSLLENYERRYPGAMYSGCGGGYIYVAAPAEEVVPGAFHFEVRVGPETEVR